MEELIIIKQISYSCVFPKGKDNLEELLKIIPSKSAISWASNMLLKKKMKIKKEEELQLFIPLLFKMNNELQHALTKYLELIKNEINNFNFIDEVTLLILIEHLLENHNNKSEDVFTSEEDFSNLFITYLICCDEKLEYSNKIINHNNNSNSLRTLILPEQLRINDIYCPKDYRIEFLRFYYFMIFCEGDKKFREYLKLFLQDNHIKKWDDYLYFIFNTYSSTLTNSQGSTNLIKIDPDNYYGKPYLDRMCIDVENFKKTADFTHLRSKPIYYHGDNTYSIISTNFFIDKMFQSFLFDFASVLIKHKQITKINSYPELKAMVGNFFTENHLFYELMKGCFSKTYKKLISGQELKKYIGNGEPDFYIRKGKNIFIFEFKDVMLNAKTKQSKNIEIIKSEIFQLFVSSTIEKNTGKQKKKPQSKGITQLLNVIESKLDLIIHNVDKIEVTDKLNVYPIIVYQDSCLDIEGINYILSNKFEELKTSKNISETFLIKKCVMMPFKLMISLEDYFQDGRLELGILIDNFINECNLSEKNKLLPFNKFIMRQAYKLGYKNRMSQKFKSVFDSIVEKNK
ncbi:MAG: hypothetical protein IMY73_04625 [Bacteroidetes bacterium]|nr:hypothetical protein [Bacteroidota bacterium]